MLAVAADRFVVRTANGPTAVAGYPWFGEWSRDLFTSYEGLFLVHRPGRGGARGAAPGARRSVSEGMLANTADVGTLEYNTIDATLWFLHALGRHVARPATLDLAAELADSVVDDPVRARAGTRFGIGVDPANGLLRRGRDGWALTWMDARIDGGRSPRGPASRSRSRRSGSTALGAAADLLDRRRARRRRWSRLRGAGRVVVRGAVRARRRRALPTWWTVPAATTPTVRPNQLLAASLPYGR